MDEILDISGSTLFRIESSETESVSSETVMNLTELSGVSADLIPGISDDPAKSEAPGLGMPEKAVRVMSSGKADMKAIRLLPKRNRQYLKCRFCIDSGIPYGTVQAWIF